MKATIYYFSGTGNSLHAARVISSGLPGANVVNMATLTGMKEIEVSEDAIGLVFPVYFWDMPAYIADFVRRLKIAGQPYIFAVATCGGGPGNTLFTLERKLRQKVHKLSSGFTVDMPSNAYVGFDLMTPKSQWNQMLGESEKRLADIAEIVAKKELSPAPGRRSALKTAATFVMEKGATGGYNLPRHYRTNERCNGCGSCEKICPTGNIKVTDKKAIWGNHCAYCQACFHWCPKQAVQLSSKTESVPRYHHPQITIRDMQIR
jgi:Pyruvate/2-oxoacid:ferredoxin oxidoreductase delta subunit/flavodoxin